MIRRFIFIACILFFIFHMLVSAQNVELVSPAGNIEAVNMENKISETEKTAYFDYAFKEFGVFSGFHRGTLKEKEDYEIIPIMLHFGFDLRPLIKNKSNILFEFLLEPFINTVISPDYNVEIGNNFLFKFAFPIVHRIYPYVEAGLGIAYLTQHTREQATQFNFTDQIGIGITYFLKKNLSFNLGYRFRHISNASIKHPNSGIDCDSFIFGISFLY